jgi:uncharacterized protein (DUF302 family)
MTIEGLITIASSFATQDTLARLENEIAAFGLTVFARIDHAAGAAAAGLVLRPTVVVIFGNAKGGTALMQITQTIGIDLPLKMLVHEDGGGKTWLSYNDSRWLAARHGIVDAPMTEKLAVMLSQIAFNATQHDPR